MSLNYNDNQFSLEDGNKTVDNEHQEIKIIKTLFTYKKTTPVLGSFFVIFAHQIINQ
jgi:hypothetical protein